MVKKSQKSKKTKNFNLQHRDTMIACRELKICFEGGK